MDRDPSTEKRRLLAVYCCLAALPVAGGWLRARGIDFGLPLELRPDEQIYRDAVGVAAMYLVMIVGARFVAYARHVLPLVPLLCVLTACLLDWLASRFDARSGGVALWLVLVILILFPAYRASMLTSLFLTTTSFENVLGYAHKHAGRAPIAAPDPIVERSFTTRTISAWDPPALFDHDEWWLIDAEHPLFDKSSSETGTHEILEIAGQGIAGYVEGAVGGSAPPGRFERTDWFFYPFADFTSLIEHPGPNFRLFRVRPDPTRTRRIAPRLSVKSDAAAMQLDIAPADTEPARCFSLRFKSPDKRDRGLWDPAASAPGSLRTLPLSSLSPHVGSALSQPRESAPGPRP